MTTRSGKSFHITVHREAVLEDWNELQVYYQGIQYIQKHLRCYTNGDLEPSPYYWRTPYGMYLETAVSTSETEIIECLYTPFGEIRLSEGCRNATSLVISQAFLSTMDWHIRDVTASMRTYTHFRDEKDTVNCKPVRNETYPGSNMLVKVYRIDRIGSIRYTNVWPESVVFRKICECKECYARDYFTWKSLSL